MKFKIGDKVKRNNKIPIEIKTVYKIYPTVYPKLGGVLQMIPGDFIIRNNKRYRYIDKNVLKDVLVDESIYDNFWFVNSCKLIEQNKCNCPLDQLLISGCTCGGN